VGLLEKRKIARIDAPCFPCLIAWWQRQRHIDIVATYHPPIIPFFPHINTILILSTYAESTEQSADAAAATATATPAASATATAADATASATITTAAAAATRLEVDTASGRANDAHHAAVRNLMVYPNNIHGLILKTCGVQLTLLISLGARSSSLRSESLKSLSPTIADQKIMELAKTFENVTFQRSPSKVGVLPTYL
jgi:hypothetical protein